MRHLVEKGHTKEAASYVQRCDSHKRIDLYVECGEWVMAGKECKDRGDRAKLECVSFFGWQFRTDPCGVGSCARRVLTL